MTLTLEQRQKLKQFHEDGLVWLVNTAILHPRGLALMIAYPDPEDGDEHPDLPLWLGVTGDGDEPWVFGDDQVDDPDIPFGLVKRYMAAEAKREREWSPALEAARPIPPESGSTVGS